jgi:class 3 adenylate cyclase
MPAKDALPTTQYARSGDLNVAYQTIGDGPMDLIIVPGLITHVEFLHELPGYTDFLRRLSAFSRVVTFDKSGQGLSDRWFGAPSLERRMDDIGAVMEAIGSKRAALLGCSEGTSISVMFAATYPDRVSHLVLFGGAARYTATEDYPVGYTREELQQRVGDLFGKWGTGAFISVFLPSRAENTDAVRQFAKLERLTFSPGAFMTFVGQNLQIDIRPVLPTIRHPALVLQRRSDRLTPVEAGRDLANRIPGAKYIEYADCDDHLIFAGDQQMVSGDIEEFLTGSRESKVLEHERVLATILFTDIVGSTERAAESGDQAWRRVLDAHDAAAHRLVTHHRGKVVKMTGDGMLAIFDGPGRAIRCAQSLQAAVEPLGVELRVGLHTGEIEIRGDDISGLAVHAAARVMAQSTANEILVSRVVTDLVAGAGLKFCYRGSHEFKGFPGMWELFSVSA